MWQCMLCNLVANFAPPEDQILNQSKWCHLVAKFATNASDAIWWTNLRLLVKGGNQKKNGKKSVRLTAWVDLPPQSGQENMKNSTLTSTFDLRFLLYMTQNKFYSKNYFLTTDPLTNIHGFSCLGTVKKASKIH